MKTLGVVLATVAILILAIPASADRGTPGTPPKRSALPSRQIGEQSAVVVEVTPCGNGCNVRAWTYPPLVRQVSGYLPSGSCDTVGSGTRAYVRTRRGNIEGFRTW